MDAVMMNIAGQYDVSDVSQEGSVLQVGLVQQVEIWITKLRDLSQEWCMTFSSWFSS